MTYIKMCGLRREEDVLAAVESGADLTGFILTQRFWRSITEEQMRTLKALVPPLVKAVGVFVDEPVEYPARLLKEGVIDIAQLHGKEDNEYIRQLKALIGESKAVYNPKTACGTVNWDLIRVIKAFKITEKGDMDAAENSQADLVLLDSGTGTGKTFDWSLVGTAGRAFLLAGGLEPDNVAEAVTQIRPLGVDVSSGIETDKVKDPRKMQHFADQVRKAEQ